MTTPRRRPLLIAAGSIALTILAGLSIALTGFGWDDVCRFLADPIGGTGTMALAAVTAGQLIKRREGCRGELPIAASTSIYQGTLVFSDVSGYAVGIVASGANPFRGVATKDVDNASGAAGDLKAEFWTEGQFVLTGSGFSQASVGLNAYATDNYTVTTSGQAASYIGRIVGYVSATQVLVEIVSNDRYQQTLTAAADSGAGSSILPATKMVNVTGVTTDANDWIVLPAIASVPIGHEIYIACNAGSNFELRTPASSNTKINDVDSDGSQEHLCTDTHLIRIVKHTTTGWVAQSLTKLGAVATAVVPD